MGTEHLLEAGEERDSVRWESLALLSECWVVQHCAMLYKYRNEVVVETGARLDSE